MPSSGSGGRGGHGPPVKISHKKDGRRRQLHRFHVSRPPPYPVAGSATGATILSSLSAKTEEMIYMDSLWRESFENLPEGDMEGDIEISATKLNCGFYLIGVF